ncbi:hypothetical protein JTB14_019822 [Gonioctena quinquepunctata]|nr:hypothetical protein JTB14_019822 [Gonioctena quinquepunctata]
MISVSVYGIYGKLFVVPIPRNTIIIRIADLTRNISELLASVVATIRCVLIYPEKLKLIVSAIGHFDKKNPALDNKMKKWFWFCFILSSLYTPLYIFMRRMFWSSSGYSKYYNGGDLIYLQLNMGIFLYFWLAEEILERFKALNKSLENISKNARTTKILARGYKVKIFLVKRSTIRELGIISKHYNCLVDILHNLNDLFGYFVMLYVVFVIAFVMNSIASAFWYTTSLRSFINGFMDIFAIRCIHFISTTEVLVRVIAIAAVGTFLLREARRTTTICYNIIDALQYDSTQEAEVLKRELRHFVDQVAQRTPRLSAAGFFNIDFTMMGFIISSITSYIIVAIQFLKEH